MSELITEVLMFLMNLGYIGIAIGLMIEVIPSEIVLSYAGYLVSKGQISFVGAVVAGTIGGTLAQLFLYWLGYYGGRPLVLKYGKYIFIGEHHLQIAENWFNRYGVGVIFAARFVPVVRHAISIPAGLAKMNGVQFTVYTTLAIIPWSIGFIFLGNKLGENWNKIKSYIAPYTPYLIGSAVLVLLLYFGLKLFGNRRKY